MIKALIKNASDVPEQYFTVRSDLFIRWEKAIQNAQLWTDEYDIQYGRFKVPASDLPLMTNELFELRDRWAMSHDRTDVFDAWIEAVSGATVNGC